MFNQSMPGYRIPSAPVDKIEITQASLGGGFVVTMWIENKPEMMVFTNAMQMAQNLFGMLLGPMISQRPSAPVAEVPFGDIVGKPEGPVEQKAQVNPVLPTKKRGGRPKLTEAEKAANKAKRAALAANGVDHAAEKLPAEPKVEAGAETTA